LIESTANRYPARRKQIHLVMENLTSHTRKALVDGADEIQDDYRTQLEAALHAVEAAALEDPKTKIGDTGKLQAACAALDEVTKPLAEILMNRAMDALLRKRGVIQ